MQANIIKCIAYISCNDKNPIYAAAGDLTPCSPCATPRRHAWRQSASCAVITTATSQLRKPPAYSDRSGTAQLSALSLGSRISSGHGGSVGGRAGPSKMPTARAAPTKCHCLTPAGWQHCSWVACLSPRMQLATLNRHRTTPACWMHASGIQTSQQPSCSTGAPPAPCSAPSWLRSPESSSGPSSTRRPSRRGTHTSAWQQLQSC